MHIIIEFSSCTGLDLKAGRNAPAAQQQQEHTTIQFVSSNITVMPQTHLALQTRSAAVMQRHGIYEFFKLTVQIHLATTWD